jgi:hypothetical protein
MMTFLGVSLPSASARTWGIILVCLVQLYFLIHLRELTPKIGDGDNGTEIAWIGLYPSMLSRGVTFLSVVIVPVLTTIALSSQALKLSTYAGLSAIRSARSVIPVCIAISASLWMGVSSVQALDPLRRAVSAKYAKSSEDRPPVDDIEA